LSISKIRLPVFSSMRPEKNKLLLLAGSTLWLMTVGAGVGILWHYENTPGIPAIAAPAQWPSDSHIQRSNLATLIMIVHPHCPCSRASLAELARLMAQAQGRVTAFVLFNKPPKVSRHWEHTDLWDTAAAIPGVNVMADDEGIEARRFHAATSGQTMLYDKDGNLLFSGGITDGRGHEGDNPGRSAIVSFLTISEADRTETPVFGCPIFARDECQTGKEASHPKHIN
jgi:hypothetical protein